MDPEAWLLEDESHVISLVCVVVDGRDSRGRGREGKQLEVGAGGGGGS